MDSWLSPLSYRTVLVLVTVYLTLFLFIFIEKADLEQWESQEVNLNNGVDRIVFEAWIGELVTEFGKSQGDISLDDIEIINSPGGCVQAQALSGKNNSNTPLIHLNRMKT